MASFVSVLVCACPISLTDTAIPAKARAFLHMGTASRACQPVLCNNMTSSNSYNIASAREGWCPAGSSQEQPCHTFAHRFCWPPARPPLIAAAGSGHAQAPGDEVETITVTSSALLVQRDSVTGSVDVLDRDTLIRNMAGNIAQFFSSACRVCPRPFPGRRRGRPAHSALGWDPSVVRVLINGLDGLDAFLLQP